MGSIQLRSNLLVQEWKYFTPYLQIDTVVVCGAVSPTNAKPRHAEPKNRYFEYLENGIEVECLCVFVCASLTHKQTETLSIYLLYVCAFPVHQWTTLDIFYSSLTAEHTAQQRYYSSDIILLKSHKKIISEFSVHHSNRSGYCVLHTERTENGTRVAGLQSLVFQARNWATITTKRGTYTPRLQDLCIAYLNYEACNAQYGKRVYCKY